MKIHVTNIPEEGIELSEQLDPRKISLDLSRQGINFNFPITIRAKIIKAGREVFADINLEVPVEYTCARCLCKIHDVFNKQFTINYELEFNDILDMDEDIRQEIILDYPMKVVCRHDCKGLCLNCGQNLNIAKCECK